MYSHYITDYLHNYFVDLITKNMYTCCDNILIAVSLIQYIVYVKSTFYTAPYGLSDAERSHFISYLDDVSFHNLYK